MALFIGLGFEDQIVVRQRTVQRAGEGALPSGRTGGVDGIGHAELFERQIHLDVQTFVGLRRDGHLLVVGEGERKLEWYARVQQEKVKLYLRDTGTGISAKDLPRVFEKGFTGSNGRTHEHSTGMGLYLVRELAKSLNFDCQAQSEYGKGFGVELRFPVV